jgi:hypothetical protein
MTAPTTPPPRISASDVFERRVRIACHAVDACVDWPQFKAVAIVAEGLAHPSHPGDLFATLVLRYGPGTSLPRALENAAEAMRKAYVEPYRACLLQMPPGHNDWGILLRALDAACDPDPAVHLDARRRLFTQIAFELTPEGYAAWNAVSMAKGPLTQEQTCMVARLYTAAQYMAGT